MDFDLTAEQVSEIQVLNAKLISIKSLIKEVTQEDNSALFSKLIGEMAKTQIVYDKWFEKMQTQFNINTRPEQSWNVDFNNKKLQLLG